MNHGSPKPLNWNPTRLDTPISKSTSIDSRVETHHRAGTPITRRGSYNGVIPPFKPNPYVPELNPELILKGDYDGPGELDYAEIEKSRQKALDYAFSKALGLPQVPTRQQQPPDQGQAPQLAQPKIPGFEQAGLPPQSQMQVQQQQPIGYTADGQAIYPDPFHPEHQGFQPADHEAAATAQQNAGNMQAANAHSEQVEDVKSPMDRAAGKFPGAEDPPSELSPQPQAPGAPPGAPEQAPDSAQVNPPMGQPPNQEAPTGPPVVPGDQGGPQEVMQVNPPMGQPEMPLGAPQGQPPMGAQSQPDVSPGDLSQTVDLSQVPMEVIEAVAQFLEDVKNDPPEHPDQGKPQPPPQIGDEREGPKPGMSESDTPSFGEDSQDQAAMFGEDEGADNAVPEGANSSQAPKGMPRPMKQVGSQSPMTHAGSQDTPVEQTSKKSLFAGFGW